MRYLIHTPEPLNGEKLEKLKEALRTSDIMVELPRGTTVEYTSAEEYAAMNILNYEEAFEKCLEGSYQYLHKMDILRRDLKKITAVAENSLKHLRAMKQEPHEGEFLKKARERGRQRHIDRRKHYE